MNSLKPIFTHVLPPGWAGNTANTAIYRGAGLVSAGGWQFGCYYENERSLLLFRRDLASDEVSLSRLELRASLQDAHNVASLGVDAEGYLHLAYDHHGTALNYRRSTERHSIEDWEDLRGMTGVWEDRVTYPYFVTPTRTGQPLLFFYRRGRAEQGDLHLKVYDTERRRWRDVPAPILSGSGQQPWSAGPYINHPAVDASGRLHLFFTWRTALIGPESFVNNHNLDYARSDDWGASWEASNGQPLRLPITPVTSETALGTPPGCNLINQGGAAADAGGPLAASYMDGPDGRPRCFLLYREAGEWRRRWVGNGVAFAAKGRGTLRLPLSRPDVVLDSGGNRFLLYRVFPSAAADASATARRPGHLYLAGERRTHLLRSGLEHYEPLVDRTRSLGGKLLSLLLQRTSQPDREGVAKPRKSAMLLAEWSYPVEKTDRAASKSLPTP